MTAPHILILGAGFAGFTVARELRREAAAHRIRLTVVDPQPYLTYKPLLPEVAGGAAADLPRIRPPGANLAVASIGRPAANLAPAVPARHLGRAAGAGSERVDTPGSVNPSSTW